MKCWTVKMTEDITPKCRTCGKEIPILERPAKWMDCKECRMKSESKDRTLNDPRNHRPL